MDVGTILVSTIGALLAAPGGVAIVNAISGRKKTQADVVGSLTDSALELLNAAKAETAEARREIKEVREEAAGARREAHETRRQMRHVREEADQLVGYLRRVVSYIHDPTMTLERLRVLVGNDPPNGLSSPD